MPTKKNAHTPASEPDAPETAKKPAVRRTVKKIAPDTVEVSAVKKAVRKVPTVETAPDKPIRKSRKKAEAATGAAADQPARKTRKKAEPQRPAAGERVVFIGSECYPFVKTGGLGDVMYALPRALSRQGCEVRVLLPRYRCIPQVYQDKMIYRGEFWMDLYADGRTFYVGIMEYIWDGVIYDFIDNEDFFSYGNPYTNLYDDIPRYCFFAKAALAALNYMDCVPDVIHCHDWQAALVPVYLRTLFAGTPVARAKSILTIHNLRFQGVCGIPALKYWSGLPGHVFCYEVMKQGDDDANMLKAGLAYADRITTVSTTYAEEIQTPFYGDGLDPHLRYHADRLSGIVNGIDIEQWNSAIDTYLAFPYDHSSAVEMKRANKLALQEALGLEKDERKMLLGLISRLTDQKGLDLVNAILPDVIDGNTQVVVLGTGEPVYENAFRNFEQTFKGAVCAYIAYDESLAHRIYAGADALLVPSLFEPCGLTQLIAMRYGTVPIVRETGGLKDTVLPYDPSANTGSGFTFDRYEAGLLLDAVNRAKTLYFTGRERWDEMLRRDMEKDVSWDNAAAQYRALYRELKA